MRTSECMCSSVKEMGLVLCVEYNTEVQNLMEIPTNVDYQLKALMFGMRHQF